jgi:uncharacterized membrane protein YgcG
MAHGTGSGVTRTRALATSTLVGAAFALLATFVPATASAHTLLTTPPPRDEGQAGADAHKTGPCGGVVRTAKRTVYATPGAMVPVTWKETIAHRGCYQIWLSNDDDKTFTKLAQFDDPAGGAGMTYTQNVKLPDGVTCQSCTLQIRQLMINMACAADQQSLAAGDTYFSCADISIGDFDGGGPPADGGASSSSSSSSGASGTSGTSGGTSGTSGSGGGDGGAGSSGAASGSSSGDPRSLRAGQGDDGCSVGWGSPAGMSAFAVGAVAALAIARRRKKR